MENGGQSLSSVRRMARRGLALAVRRISTPGVRSGTIAPSTLLGTLGHMAAPVGEFLPDSGLERGGIRTNTVLEILHEFVRPPVVYGPRWQELVAERICGGRVTGRPEPGFRRRQPVHGVADSVVEGQEVGVGPVNVLHPELEVMKRFPFAVGQIRTRRSRGVLIGSITVRGVR